jgi:hypothetical protein
MANQEELYEMEAVMENTGNLMVTGVFLTKMMQKSSDAK